MDPIEGGALAAAKRLEGLGGRQLTAQVTGALKARDDPQHRIIDPISLGTLIVSVATLAWTVYRDLRSDEGNKRNKSSTVVVQSVRRQLDWEGDINTTEHAEVIQVTVEETVAAAERQGK